MNLRQGGSMGDELTNAALIALIGAFGLALALRGAGSVAAFLSGTPQPQAGPASGLGVLFNPTDPARALDAEGLSPVVYWIVTTLLLTILVAGVAWVWMWLRRHNRKVATDPHRLAGIATSHEVKTTASPKALLRRAGTLRPSLETPTPSDVGYLLGASRGTGVWASVEDSVLLIGPPRSGKGLHVVINAILDAPGAVVTTSTRPDNLTATLRSRRRKGGTHPARPNPASRPHPHPALRHRHHPAALRTAHRHRPTSLAEPPRLRPTPSRPGRARSTLAPPVILTTGPGCASAPA